MMHAKAKWQQEIEVATGPNSVVAQLLNARMFDLEVTVMAQAQRIKCLEDQQVANFDLLRTSLENSLKLMRREIRDELRRDVRRGLLR